MTDTSRDILSAVPRHKDVLAAEAGDALMFMRVDTGEYLMMEDTARAIWEAIDGAKSGREIVDLMIAEYEVSRETCGDNVSEFLAELERRGMIDLIAPSG